MLENKGGRTTAPRPNLLSCLVSFYSFLRGFKKEGTNHMQPRVQRPLLRPFAGGTSWPLTQATCCTQPTQLPLTLCRQPLFPPGKPLICFLSVYFFFFLHFLGFYINEIIQLLFVSGFFHSECFCNSSSGFCICEFCTPLLDCGAIKGSLRLLGVVSTSHVLARHRPKVEESQAPAAVAGAQEVPTLTPLSLQA